MKRIIISLLLAAASLTATAQANLKSYQGFLETGFGYGGTITKGDDAKAAKYGKEDFFFDVSTTHGYNFSENLFLGAGAAYIAGSKLKHSFVPAYMSARLSFPTATVLRFVEARGGIILGGNVEVTDGQSINKGYGSVAFGIEVSEHINILVRCNFLQLPDSTPIAYGTIGLAFTIGRYWF